MSANTVTIDFEGLSPATFEPLPEGKYKLVVSGWEVKLSKSASKPTLYVNLDVKGTCEEDMEFDGRKLFHTYSLDKTPSPKSDKSPLQYTWANLMTGFGLTAEDVAVNIKDATFWIGREVLAFVVIESRKDEADVETSQNKIKRISPVKDVSQFLS